MEEVNEVLELNPSKNSKFNSIRQSFAQNLGHGLGLSQSHYLPPVSAEFTARIEFISKFYKFDAEEPLVLQKFEKNDKISQLIRSKGNTFYREGNMHKAMKLYNLAIMFAEPAGEGIGIAFGNRSAVLQRQRDPLGALEDVKLAIKHNYPERLMWTLTQRREECEQMLGKFAPFPSHTNIKLEVANTLKYRDELLKLKKPNPLMPSAESLVGIEHTDELGRHLVVNTNDGVPAGTVVLVEKPYTSVNGRLLKFDANHCDTCYKFIKNSIPCEKCVFVVYCSEACRSNGQYGHHKFQCSCLSSLYLASTDPETLLAFRIVCKVGPEEFYRLFTTGDPDYFGIKAPFGTASNVPYQSNSYFAIHHLIYHSNLLGTEERYENGLKALQLMSILHSHSTFFKDSPKYRSQNFEYFIAAILLRLKEALPHNVIAIEELKAFQGPSLADINAIKEVESTLNGLLNVPDESRFFEKSSVGIYAVGSLMNDSCDANVVKVFDSSHGTMVVVTTKALKKGEPLTLAYGFDFSLSKRDERRRFLMHGYFFKCHCKACEENWDTYGTPKDKFEDPQFTCPTCSTKLIAYDMTGLFLTCRLCRKTSTRHEMMQTFASNVLKFTDTCDDFKYTHPVAVAQAYKEVLPYFQSNIAPPHGFLASSRMSFRRVLALILQSRE